MAVRSCEGGFKSMFETEKRICHSMAGLLLHDCAARKTSLEFVIVYERLVFSKTFKQQNNS
jgi:hypothetical protein